MKRIKVTDLEKFVKQHIYNPYLNSLPEGINHTITLKNAVRYLIIYPEWADLVMKRIKNINFYFPDYISHQLVELIKNWPKDGFTKREDLIK